MEESHLFVFATGKAGMDSVDQTKVNETILRLSKDSEYYKNEQRKAAKVEARITQVLSKKLDTNALEALNRHFERLSKKLSSELDLSRVWIHIDMDQFYAAVAERDNPWLKGKPVAVGGLSMISTANYVARKFGVRSAMPGFIGKELCPDLIFVKHGAFLAVFLRDSLFRLSGLCSSSSNH
jgi:DNA polymerase kappa